MWRIWLTVVLVGVWVGSGWVSASWSTLSTSGAGSRIVAVWVDGGAIGGNAVWWQFLGEGAEGETVKMWRVAGRPVGRLRGEWAASMVSDATKPGTNGEWGVVVPVWLAPVGTGVWTVWWWRRKRVVSRGFEVVTTEGVGEEVGRESVVKG